MACFSRLRGGTSQKTQGRVFVNGAVVAPKMLSVAAVVDIDARHYSIDLIATSLTPKLGDRDALRV